jgi:hypothetical protein
MVILVLPCRAQPVWGSDKDDVYSTSHFRTSYCQTNYLEIDIDGDQLNLSGTFDTATEGSEYVITANMIGFGDDAVTDHENVGEPFSITLPLDPDDGQSSALLQVWIGEENSFLMGYKPGWLEVKRSGNRFVMTQSPVLESNLNKEAGWVNPREFLNTNIDPTVKTLAESITFGADTDYEKLMLLYDWTITNIFYDMNAYYDQSLITTDPLSILQSKKAVCAGYSNLLCQLLQSQGIPAMQVYSYALGMSTSGAWDENNINTTQYNHATVEAWADRWILLDATWDSQNKFSDGTYEIKEPGCYRYFDMTMASFSMSHKIISRPQSSVDDIPSDWAMSEARSALSEGLIPYELQGGYRNCITRRQFCNILVNMICNVENTSIERLLNRNGLSLDKSGFTDTTDQYVLTANAFGIVNGRGGNKFGPDLNVTRQEAAVMLARTAKILELSSEYSPGATYADNGKIADWAAESVKYLSSLKTPQGVTVMGGTGNGNFTPNGGYSIEQSILTIERLYQCY